jgi:hypothetical protein
MSGTSSTPLSTMKTLQKHLYSYSVLPRPAAATSRVRSNSASRSSAYTTNSAGVPLSFFDTPPPPPRPHIMNSGRLAVEARADMESGNSNVPNSTLPFSLALTAPLNNSPSSSPTFSSHAAFFPYSSLATSTATTSSKQSASKAPSYHKQQKFQLDVGAYGIPKKCRNHVMNSQERQRAARGLHTQASDDSNLSVQVGEDAYFIRDNAMGVADGVGGWDRMRLRGAFLVFLKKNILSRLIYIYRRIDVNIDAQRSLCSTADALLLRRSGAYESTLPPSLPYLRRSYRL